MQIYQKLPKKCTESLVIALLGVLEKNHSYCFFQNVSLFLQYIQSQVSGISQKRTEEEGARQFFRRLLCCYPANYQLQPN